MRNNICFMAIMLAVLTVTAVCGTEKVKDTSSPGKYTVAVAEILTEVNAFSPITTRKREFEAESLLYGDDIIHCSRKKSMK